VARERKEVVPGFTRSELNDWKREAKATSQQWEDGFQAGLDEAGDFFSGDSGSPGNGEQSDSGGSAPASSGVRLSFSQDAQKIIVVALSITVIVALVENAHMADSDKTKKDAVPPSTIIVGGFVSGAILLGMSYFLPEFASGFAIVAMLSTLLERGKPFWDIIGSLTGTKIPTVEKPGPTPSQSPQRPGSVSPIGTNVPMPTITV